MIKLSQTVQKYEPFKEQNKKFTRLPKDLETKNIIEPHQKLPENCTRLAGIPIAQKHSLTHRARNILTHNHSNEVTRVSVIGKTGSNKSTLVWFLIHLLHTMAEAEFGVHYGVVWAGKEQLRNMREWIKTLPYGVNLIICFDDISFETEKMGKKAKLDLKQLMTEIRHELGDVHLITFYNYHYTKGMDKQMRDTDVVILTSYSHEEDANVRQLLGWWNSAKFGTFQKALRTALTKGYWITPVPAPNSDKVFLYYWKNPLTFCLIDDFGDVGFGMFVNPADHPVGEYGCNLCCPPDKAIGSKLPAQDFLDGGVKAFGPEFLGVCRDLMYFIGARDCYNGNNYDILKYIKKHLKIDRVDLDDLADILVRTKKRGNTFKQLPKEKEKAIAKQIRKDSEIKQAKKINENDIFGEFQAFTNMVEKEGENRENGGTG